MRSNWQSAAEQLVRSSKVRDVSTSQRALQPLQDPTRWRLAIFALLRLMEAVFRFRSLRIFGFVMEPRSLRGAKIDARLPCVPISAVAIRVDSSARLKRKSPKRSHFPKDIKLYGEGSSKTSIAHGDG